jgi:hypothetical protein
MLNQATELWVESKIPRKVLAVSAVLTALLALTFLGVLWCVGVPGAVALGMGFLAGTRPATTLSPRDAALLAVPTALTGAVAVGLQGQPFVAACFVALICLMVAPAEIRKQGLLSGVPTVAAVLVSLPGDFHPATTAGWMMVGSLLLIGIAVVAKFPRVPTLVVDPAHAWRHAIVMAVAAATVVYAVQYFGIPHGYWIAVTLTVVLRPLPDITRARGRQRVLGTVGGVVLALVLATAFPGWAVTIALAVCMTLMISYALLDDYLRQVVFLTPSVVLLAPAGGAELVALERAVATLIGAFLAGALALFLVQTDDPGVTVEDPG